MASHSHEEPSLSPCTMINCFELVTRPARRPAAEESLPLFSKSGETLPQQEGTRKTLRHFNKDADVARSTLVKPFRTSMVTFMQWCLFFIEKYRNMCVTVTIKMVVRRRRRLRLFRRRRRRSIRKSSRSTGASFTSSPAYIAVFSGLVSALPPQFLCSPGSRLMKLA